MTWNNPLLIFIAFGLILLAWRQLTTKSLFPTKKRLVSLLEKAEKMVSKYKGGYSGEYLSAQEFHKDLKSSIIDYRNGDDTKLDQFYIWFAPTCCKSSKNLDISCLMYNLTLSMKCPNSLKTYSRGQNAFKESNEYFNIYLLTKNHKHKTLVNRFECKEKALNSTKKLAGILNIKITDYNPTFNNKAILKNDKS